MLHYSIPRTLSLSLSLQKHGRRSPIHFPLLKISKLRVHLIVEERGEEKIWEKSVFGWGKEGRVKMVGFKNFISRPTIWRRYTMHPVHVFSLSHRDRAHLQGSKWERGYMHHIHSIPPSNGGLGEKKPRLSLSRLMVLVFMGWTSLSFWTSTQDKPFFLIN